MCHNSKYHINQIGEMRNQQEPITRKYLCGIKFTIPIECWISLEKSTRNDSEIKFTPNSNQLVISSNSHIY